LEANSALTRVPRRTSPAMAAIRRWWGRYSLIAFLLILPVAFGIHDLVSTGSLTALAENLKDGVSNGAIWALVGPLFADRVPADPAGRVRHQ
jgi:hypothetical protein